MNSISESLNLSVTQRCRRIVAAVREEEQRLRAALPLLQYQNGIAVVILLFSLSGMIASGYLYAQSMIPAWLCIVSVAMFVSLSHELEHDLIHRIYFRNNVFIQNLMMFVVWLMRPNTVNPWYRRKIHLLHHKVSGTEQDLEERLVGNGLGFGLQRFIVMFDGFIGLLLQSRQLKKEVRRYNFIQLIMAGFPLTLSYFLAWHLYLTHCLLSWLMPELIYPELLTNAVQGLEFWVVVLIAPNVLRSGCLNFITSNMHYYGGVNNLLEQTQILKSWLVFPLHLFCFNFGSTHGIHHIVPMQPFYLRQMVRKVAHKVMVEQGVRMNDWRSFRANNVYQ